MGHFPGEGARCELYLANHILRPCDSSGVKPLLGIFYELSGVEWLARSQIACHSWTGQPHITSGSRAVKPPGLQLQHVSRVPVDRTGSAEPDTLHGSLPEARLAFGHGRWFHPLLYETGQACLSATAPQAGQSINRRPWAHHHGMHGGTPWFGTPVLFVLWEQMIQKRSPVLFTERGHFPCLSTKLYGPEPGPH